ncbi:hypothetical protein DUI87_11911 [Hirundo rustica rustica]|uniref:Uncharacterized protein n=1 Tax=Hirundo rustica rustica TaxID=333673 RepID=A0A3M0KFG3_HIRRU|nr:hypothetical protein DUI87_11911 [Hirundo rustica rustica]
MGLADQKDLGLGLALSFLLSITVETSHSSDFAGSSRQPAENRDSKWVQREIKERWRRFRGSLGTSDVPPLIGGVVELLLRIQRRRNGQKVKQEGEAGEEEEEEEEEVVRAHLQSCPSPGNQHRRDLELLERVQGRHQGDQRDGAALLGGKAGRAGIVQPGGEKLWGDPAVAFQCLEELRGKVERLFPRDRVTRENGSPLPEGRDGWDVGMELFPGRVGRPWHRVPRAAVAAPGSLAVSKARLDIGAWSSLV